MKAQKINSVTYRRYFFSVKDTFLLTAETFDASLNYFFQSPVNINNSLNEFYTLLIDLHQTQEEIFKTIYERTQSEITSFLKNNVYSYEIKINLSRSELNEIISQFNTFAIQKNIRKAEVERLKAYNEKGILAVSKITVDSKTTWINIYRFTTDRATNLYSFSAETTHITNSVLGKAHRALHWLDILELKKAGVNFYDLCGWYNGSTNQELLNINKFKEQFSQNKVKEYSGVIYKNFLLSLFKKFK